MISGPERRWSPGTCGRQSSPRLSTDTRELIALPPDSSLWPWQPQARYCLLDIGSFPEEELAQRPGLAALLFRLEQQRSPVGFDVLLGEVIAWFRQHKRCKPLKGLFIELIRRALVVRKGTLGGQ